MVSWLLTMSNYLRSSEPKDRVFGLIGLLSLAAPKQRFRVDYTDPVADVYCDVTRECTKAFKGFWDLEDCGYARPPDMNFPGLPSWVPSWYCSVPIRMKTKFTAFPSGYHLWSHFVPSHNFKHEQSSVMSTRNKRKLSIQAKLLESIRCSSSEILTHEDLVAPNGRTRNFLRMARQLLPDCTAGADRECWRRVNDILTAGCDNLPLKTLLIDYEQGLARASRAKDWKAVITKDQHPDVASRQARYRLEDAFKYCLGRKVFITQSGRLGIGPSTLRAGNHVVISKLSKWPMVLRREPSPHRDEYTNVGPAYVEGIKDGDPMWKAAVWRGSVRTVYLV